MLLYAASPAAVAAPERDLDGHPTGSHTDNARGVGVVGRIGGSGVGNPVAVDLDLHVVVDDPAKGDRIGLSINVAGIGPRGVLVVKRIPFPTALPEDPTPQAGALSALLPRA